MSSTTRYFQNPYIADNALSTASQHQPDQSFWQGYIEETFFTCRLKSKCKPTHKYCDGGLYTGSLGLIYTAFHLLQKNDGSFIKDQVDIKSYVRDCLHANEVYFSTCDSRQGDEVGLLVDKAGLYLAGCLASRLLGDENSVEAFSKKYASSASLCESVEFVRHGSDELFVGRAGYLYGLVVMKKYLNIQVLSEAQQFKLLDTMIASGRHYSTIHSSRSPLMYAYHNTEYLGAAHGLSGILQTILAFPAYLASRAEANKLVRDTVDFILTTQKANGNFPTSTEGAAHGEHKDLVHWCHGASGIVHLLARAYLVYSEPRYLRAAIECGEVIWERGLLKKGAGICHGIAGSGYGHLVLYRLTGDGKYLERARKFAEFLRTGEFRSQARIPDRPFSLFEGLGGTVCFISDLICAPALAEFPLFPIF